jgi:hypothetical protein
MGSPQKHKLQIKILLFIKKIYIANYKRPPESLFFIMGSTPWAAPRNRDYK